MIAPTMYYSDKTSLTGDMKLSGWPVCLTLANIPRGHRGQPHGHVVVALLPDVITNKHAKGYIEDNVARLRVYHRCMSLVVENLKANAKE